ncbi:MAG TPA: DUF502 domain-containing protein [Polyangiales bacterium]|nr:DUF502 domain-containing protein [Polyangiales bacterium]
MGPLMNTLIRNFLKGCLVLVPAVGTAYVLWLLFIKIDSILPLPIPGLGFAVTLSLIVLVGALASNVVGKRFFLALERLWLGVPFVRLVYSSLRDVLSVFVGQNRRFNRPVIVSLGEEPTPKLLGFITRDALDAFDLTDHVAVYLPQAVSFSGNLLLVPRQLVRPLDMHNAELMAFVVSGGVVLGADARSYTDPPTRA